MIPTHFIRGNQTTRFPRRFFFFDTEAYVDTLPTGVKELSWRCGVSSYDGWDDHKKARRETDWREHAESGHLWETLDYYSRARTRIVVCAHNLAFDARISRMFTTLPAMGWALSKVGIYRGSLSCVWRRGDGASLACVDSHSYLQMSVKKIGEYIGLGKLRDPDPEDDSGWWRRCRRDVEIIRQAMLEVWDGIAEKDMGSFARTGAGAAWNNWRHSHLTHAVLVHDNEDARQAEVQSTYAARTEAWRWGHYENRTFYDFDLGMAYARCALDLELPYALDAHLYSTRGIVKPGGRPGRRYLCRAEVRTDWPVLPTRTPDGICWPVGTFTGWWWEHELEMSKAWGATFAVSEAWRYLSAPVLEEWAEWITWAVEAPEATYSALRRQVFKHWSRALIGRFGARYKNWEAYGEEWPEDVALVEGIDRPSGDRFDLLLIGRRALISESEELGADSFPAIQSAVISECRIRLWALMATAGFDHVYHVDTDSLIVDRAGKSRLTSWSKRHPEMALREKGDASRLTIYGTRQFIFGDDRRFAGIPKSATELEDGTLVGEVWESTDLALERHDVDKVRVTPIVWRPKAEDKRRYQLPGGRTRPVEVSLVYHRPMTEDQEEEVPPPDPNAPTEVVEEDGAEADVAGMGEEKKNG